MFGAVVPVYNEEKYVEETLSKLLEIKELKEIVVVDDGSTDRTPRILDLFGRDIKRIRLEKNMGKGKAIKSGLEAINDNCKFIFFQDGDGEYPPENFYRLVEYAMEFPMVVGQRLVPIELITVRGFLANRIIYALTQCPDILSGQRLVKKGILSGINFSDGFEIETEMTLYCMRHSIPVKYVPINYFPRGWEEKKIGGRDFLKIMGIILGEKINGMARSAYKAVSVSLRPEQN